MRFTFAGMPRTSSASRRASSSESFTPPSSTYSKVMRRPFRDRELAARGEELGERPAPVDRHERVALRVGRRVERHRELHRRLLAEPADHRHEPARRDRHVALRELRAVLAEEEVEGDLEAAVVRERLAHAHEDEVRERARPLGRPRARRGGGSRGGPGRRSRRARGSARAPSCRSGRRCSPTAQPTWVETQSVRRSASGM